MASGQNLHTLTRYPRFAPGERVVLTKDALEMKLGPRTGVVVYQDGLRLKVRLDGRVTPGYFHVGFWRRRRRSDKPQSGGSQ